MKTFFFLYLIRVTLHDVLEFRDEFEGVRGNHPIVVVRRRQQHGRIFDITLFEKKIIYIKKI